MISQKNSHLQANKSDVKTPSAMTPPPSLGIYTNSRSWLAPETEEKTNFLFKCDGARKKKKIFSVRVKHIAASVSRETLGCDEVVDLGSPENFQFV